MRLWPYRRANGEHTIDVLRQLRAEAPDRTLTVLWEVHRITGPRPSGRPRVP
jgi:hypothetical protein